MSPRPAPHRRSGSTRPPGGGSGVSRSPRPRIETFVDGYELRAAVIGWEIRLRFAWTDGTPSMVSQGPWWALTNAGAHRKAARIINRDRRRRARTATAQEYDA